MPGFDWRQVTHIYITADRPKALQVPVCGVIVSSVLQVKGIEARLAGAERESLCAGNNLLNELQQRVFVIVARTFLFPMSAWIDRLGIAVHAGHYFRPVSSPSNS